MKTQKIEIGQGLTVYFYSDQKAGTITRISPSGKTIWFRYDIATRVGKVEMSESQQYTYAPSTTGDELKATKRKDGAWRLVGWDSAPLVSIGQRKAYHDYGF
jgi:hypothetical protein